MNKLSKSSVYAIKYLHAQGLKPEQISSEINLSLEKIQSVIDTIPVVAPAELPNAKDLMITKTSVKNNNSVAIMTKEASMMVDHAKTKHQQDTKPTTHIFQPFRKHT